MRRSFLLLPLLICCTGDGKSTDSSDSGLDSGSADGDGGGGVDVWADHALLEPGRIYNTAHRGGARLWPEHTLVAFQGAADAGADILEIDVHATSDGEIVVLHDDTVDRTTDGSGAVKTMDFATVRALDAGYQFTQDGGASHPYRGQGVQIPTLAEVLAAHPDALFNIEIKQQSPSIVSETIAAIQDAGVQDRVVLGSFYDQVTREARDEAPELLTALGTLEGMELYNLQADYEDSYTPPSPFFAAPVEFSGLVMTAELIDKAHRVGVRVHAWTVNDRDEMERVLDFGVEGIITDDPVTLAEVIAARGG